MDLLFNQTLAVLINSKGTSPGKEENKNPHSILVGSFTAIIEITTS